MPDAFHSIRSLLCTSTNTTPHERLFTYQRKSSSGSAVPSWLTNPGPVYVRKHARKSKHDPLVEEAELIEANPEYAFVRLNTGHETTVSLRDLALCPKEPSNPTGEAELSRNPEKPLSGDESDANDQPSTSKGFEPDTNSDSKAVCDSNRNDVTVIGWMSQ